MKKRLAMIATVVAVLSLSPMGATASACDGENPCDPPPMQLPWYCKISPFC